MPGIIAICNPLFTFPLKISRYCYKHDIKMNKSIAYSTHYALFMHSVAITYLPRGEIGNKNRGGVSYITIHNSKKHYDEREDSYSSSRRNCIIISSSYSKSVIGGEDRE